MRLKNNTGFLCAGENGGTTISLFFQTFFGVYKAKSHHLHLWIRWAYYVMSQPSFLS